MDNVLFVKAGDTVAITALGGSWLGILPHIGTVFTIIWVAIRIYETATVQSLIARWRKK